ncbi:hypothetical protein G9A89_004030 [Geosiphon pyriformis]|nr:hypothetical protein G9A89_004030 [Geosiphon pyriformis]
MGAEVTFLGSRGGGISILRSVVQRIYASRFSVIEKYDPSLFSVEDPDLKINKEKMTTIEPDVEIIRVMSDEDREKYYKVRFEIFVNEQKCSPDGEIDEHDNDPATIHLLALERSASQPIGTVRIHSYSFNSGKIGRLAVTQPFRGKGMGKLLMTAVEAYAKKEMGIEKFFLHAQEDKMGFYERNGYKVIDWNIFYEEGIPHLKMLKDSS